MDSYIGHAPITLLVDAADQSMRVDKFIASKVAILSRSACQKLINSGAISINHTPISKYSHEVHPQDIIIITFPQPEKIDLSPTKECVFLNEISLLYEHEHFLVINKPAFLTVHRPHPQNTQETVADWLCARHPGAQSVGEEGRPGIVHRLDKDTSGIMLLAKTQHAYEGFLKLFKERAIKKIYYALVEKHTPQHGSIDFAIDRHPTQPYKMTHFFHTGRDALTHYKSLTYYTQATLIEASPVTGRTHQIRVHCAALGHPLIGDTLYGSSSKLINRQALHAAAITFTFEKQKYSFTAPMPKDFELALKALEMKRETL